MKPLLHANISVKAHGGHVDDYLPIHNFIDSTKSAHPDELHRAEPEDEAYIAALIGSLKSSADNVRNLV